MKQYAKITLMAALFALAAFALTALSCLLASYDEVLLDYVPPEAQPKDSPLFTSANNSDMLLITISGAQFNETLNPAWFTLTDNGNSSSAVARLLRDTGNRAVLAFDSPALLPNSSTLKLIVDGKAVNRTPTSVSVQVQKSGNYKDVGNAGGGTGTGSRGLGRTRINSIAYNNGTFVAVGNNGLIAWSLDGETWNQIESGRNYRQSGFSTTANVNGIAWGNDRFWAAGDQAQIANSDNAIIWSTWDENEFGSSGGSSIRCIAYGAGRFIAGSADNLLVYIWDDGGRNRMSLPGFSYTDGNGRDVPAAIHAVAHGSSNGTDMFVAAGMGGRIAQTTGNDTNWYAENASANNPFNAPTGNSVNGLVWGKGVAWSCTLPGSVASTGTGVFVAVAEDGNIAWSPNGWYWQPVATPGTSEDMLSVAFNGRTFAAVGKNGAIVTFSGTAGTSDTWTALPGSVNQFPPTEDITAVCYGGGKFVAAGCSNADNQATRGNTHIVYWYEKP